MNIITEKHFPRLIINYNKCLSFYATKIMNHFVNSRISTNHDKEERLSANSGEIRIQGIVSLM